MQQIANVIEALGQLSEFDNLRRGLDAKSSGFKKITGNANIIRDRLPTAILKHYDFRVAKGKRGAARVRNGTCGGCHLALPSGQLADLRGNDVAIQVCGYCSIFVLPESPTPIASAPPAVPVALPKPQTRKSKAKATCQP